MPEASDLLASRFRLDSLIAEGGMAKVYRGTDLVLGRRVAVKVLSSALAKDPAFIVRFQREARAAASLSHSNVVSVFDTGSDGGRYFIVMEYIEGETLADLIEREAPLAPERAVSIAATVCGALAVAHSAGMVHRDVKPANVLIDRDGVVKVTDFGIAKTAADGLTQVGSVLGTVAYLSPEQAAGERVDRRSDLYSLGCMLFEMLTGQPPISGSSLVEVANKLSHYTPPPPSHLNPEVPPDLDAIVARAIAKDPDDRYADAGQMQRALAAFLGEEVLEDLDRTLVAPVGPPVARTGEERTRVLPRRVPARPRWPLLLAGIALTAAGLFATLTGNGSSTEEATPSQATTQPGTAPTVPTTAPSPSPSPSPPPPPPPTTQPAPGVSRAEVLRAVGGIVDTLAAGHAGGAISERAAREVGEEVGRALRQFDAGDADDALRDIDDARDEVAKRLEDQEVSPQYAADLNRRLDELERLIDG